MYQFDMTDAEVKHARAAARLVTRITKGEQLARWLEVGDQLLKGSAFAAKAVGIPASNKAPTGQKYGEAFSQWKDAMKFPRSKEHNALYDAAIVCARHRQLAETIIAGLDLKHRVEMGIFGLAARVRAKLREFEGETKPRQPPRTNAMLAEVRGQLADMREELAAARSENPIAHWQTAPAETGRVMRRVNRRAAETLARAVLETDGSNDDDERGAGPRGDR